MHSSLRSVLGIVAGVAGLIAISCTQGVTESSQSRAANLSASNEAAASSVSWKGHTWNITSGSYIGDTSAGGAIKGSTSNVTVDSSGYLHLKISGSGSSFTGAEAFSSDKMGFGSYYWVIQGPIDNMEIGEVLGLFPYGPAAGIGADGENELDIEFSKWNGVNGNINADFTGYPATGYGDGNYTPSYDQEFKVTLGGTSSTLTTCRIDWSSTKVVSSIWKGVQSTTASTSTAVKTYSFSGNTHTIPQAAIPVGMNLWTYGKKPTKALDIIIRDFQYIKK